MLPRASCLSLLTGLALLLGGPSGADAQPDKSPPRKEAPARVDLHGDPLPPGAVARLGTARLRHAGNVTQVAFADGGKALFSVGHDGLVRVWETATGKELRRFPWAPVGDAVTASADGKTLVTVTEDHAVHVWDLATGAQRHCFKARPLPRTADAHFPTCCVALTPDGRTLASWRTEGGQRVVRVWDLATGKELPSVAFPRSFTSGFWMHSVALSPDGKFLAGADDQHSTVHVWQTTSGKLLRKLEGFPACHLVKFSPDSKTLAVEIVGPAPFELWEVTTGKKLPVPAEASGMWYSVLFAPDGKSVAAVGGPARGHRVQWWETATGKKLHQHACRSEWASFLTFSPDGKLLAAADDRYEVRIWETATGKAAGQFLVPRTSSSPLCRLAFSPDNRTVAFAGGSNLVRLWDLPTGKEIHPAPGPRCPPATLAVSPNGKTLAALATDQTAHLWEATTGKELRRFPALVPPKEVQNATPSPALVFLPGEEAPSLVWSGQELILQNLAQQEKRRRFKGAVWASSSAFFHDRKSLLLGDAGGTIHVWDITTGKERRRFAWPREKNERGEAVSILTLRGAVSPDGGTVAVAGIVPGRQANSQRTALRLWEVLSGQERLTSVFREWSYSSGRGPVGPGDPDTISALVFSPDGAALALGHGDTIRLWDAGRGKELRRFGGAAVKAETAAFCPDGRLLAALGHEGVLYLWEVTTGTALPPVGGRHLPITCFLFSPDGRVLFTGCEDTTVLAWEVARLGERKDTLSGADLEGLWRDLAGDAARAYRAIDALAAVPGGAVRFLAERLPPVVAADAQHTARLLAALDSREYAAREKATRALEQLAHLAAPALHKALASAPALETRRRLEQLLEKLQGPVTSPALLRRLRAIVLLERLGSVEARHLLQKLAAGARPHPATNAAQAALERLRRRTAASDSPPRGATRGNAERPARE